MINVTTTSQRTPLGGGLYTPKMSMKDNLKKGFSLIYDGVTEADGSMYPQDINNHYSIGAVQSHFSSIYETITAHATDNGLMANNAFKWKHFDDFFLGYKTLDSVMFGLRQKKDEATGLNGNSSLLNNIAKTFPLTSTTFVHFYTLNFDGIYCVIGTIAGDGSISFGTPSKVTAHGASVQYLEISDVAQVATNKFLISVQQTITLVSNIVVSISGSTITVGTPVTQTITSTGSLGNFYLNIKKVDTDKAIVSFTITNSLDVYAYIVNISGTVPSFGSVTAILGTNATRITPCLTSATSGVFFSSNNTGNQINCLAFTISGTTITTGNLIVVTVSTSNRIYTKLLPNGNMWVLVGYGTSDGTEMIFNLTSGNVTLVGYQSSDRVNVQSITSKDVYDISANEWALVGGSKLWVFTYDTASGSTYSRRYDLVNVSTYLAISLVKCGSQFITINGNESSNGALTYGVAHSGNIEIYVNDETTALATISNTVGWGIGLAKVNKEIKKISFSLKIKNVTGQTVTLVTDKWWLGIF